MHDDNLLQTLTVDADRPNSAVQCIAMQCDALQRVAGKAAGAYIE